MCKYVVLFLVLSLSINFANAFESKLKMNKPNVIIASHENARQKFYFPPHHYNDYHQNNYLSNGNLNALEKYALNRTYKRENDRTRIERLENLAFGTTQNGDLDSRYANVEQAILSRPKYKTKNSALSNLASYLTGAPTGYTPSIDRFYNSTLGLPPGLGFTNFGGDYIPAPGYLNQNFEQYSNGPFSQGWGMSNQNYGTGSSVRILD